MKKGQNKAWGIFTKVVSMIMVFALFFTFANPMTASAKVKKKTLKNCSSYEYHLSAVEPLAAPIKKGSYNFKLKKIDGDGRAYLKFTAPKSKKYSFTLSNLRSNNGTYANGYFQVDKVDTELEDYVKEGKAYHTATKFSYGFKRTNTAKVYLNEGESAYIYFELNGDEAKYVRFDFRIK